MRVWKLGFCPYRAAWSFWDKSSHQFGLRFLCEIKGHEMFLKIPFSTKCSDSYTQVIFVGCCRTMVWLLSLPLPSSFGGHHWKAFLKQIGKKILVPSSQLLTYSNCVSSLHRSHYLVSVYVYGMSRQQSFSTKKKWDAVLTEMVGLLGWSSAWSGGGPTFSLINLPSIYSGNGLLKAL